MPTYDFKCKSCGNEIFDEFLRVSEIDSILCTCGEKMEVVLQPVASHFGFSFVEAGDIRQAEITLNMKDGSKQQLDVTNKLDRRANAKKGV